MAIFKPRNGTGFGFLGMTWRPVVVPDEDAFPAMKAAIANGATVWSSSSIYGMPPEPLTACLSLLRRYFEKYPDEAPKVTLFIRAYFDRATFSPVCTQDGVRACAEESNSALGGTKKMDISGSARIDPNVPLEETGGALKELLDEGQIGGVGLSEAGSPTIRKAHALCPLGVVEVEFSLWSLDILTNAVASTCKELDIPILTYAPLGYRLLTGRVTKLEDIPRGDIRHMFGRFQLENFPKSLELVDVINKFAKRMGVTPAQLALAWILAHSNTDQCGTIISVPGASAANRVEENCT
ncbi:MAG: hypothetical protein Q9178_007086 [Gyalolechia marmorata]